MSRLPFLLAAVLIGTAASAHEYRIGEIEIVHPHMPAPPQGARTAAGYLEIRNLGTEADVLVGVEADFAKMSMLHLSKVDAAGVASMSHLEQLEIPPGATVTLEPGGYHVMFMGITGPVPEGQMMGATLTFEQAGPVEVEFIVDGPGAVHDHDTGTRDGSDAESE